MKLAALVESADHVCTRYRISAFQSILETAGHSLSIHEIPRGWWGRYKLAGSIGDVDIAVVQRKLFSALEVARLRSATRQLWFDFDDAVWMRDSYSDKGFQSSKRLARFRNVVQASDCVIAGNAFLAETAREAGSRNCIVIPTCVDYSGYPIAQHHGPGADLVWIGSSSTLQGLEAITPLLEAIGERVPSVRLKLICDRFFRLTHLPVIECPWSKASERAEIASAGIGISWIPDDPWSKGKCGLKVLQYMAAGLPVVANPVGVHSEMIEHGRSGFLASNKEEWIEAITSLADNPELRARFGTVGRKIVCERYSIEFGGKSWCELINRHVSQRASA